MATTNRVIPMMVAAWALAACQADAPAPVMETSSPATADTPGEPARSTDTATVPVPQPADPSAGPLPAFVDRTWVVASSSAVAEGTRYRFVESGRLEVTGPDATAPTTGTWRPLGEGRIELTEDGIAYPVDILEQRRDLLRLRALNPGPALELVLVPAGDD